MKPHLLTLCLIAIIANNPALAEEEPLETIRVTGTHLRLPGAHAGTTIDKATIAAQVSPDLIDSLKGVSGVDIFRQGGSGSKSFLSIRGGEPNFTIIMLDGIRLNNPTDSRGGGFDLALISPETVERIEIIKGGYSAVYGSDALSGVMNIVTRPVNENGAVTAHAGIGSDDSIDIGTSLDGGLGEDASGRISVNYRDGGSWHMGDQRKTLDLSGQAHIDLGEDGKIRLFGFHANSDATAFPEDSGGPRLAIIRTPESHTNVTSTLGTELALAVTRRWHPLLSVSWSRSVERTTHPGIAPGTLQGIPPNSSTSKYHQMEIVQNNQLDFGDKLSTGFGTAIRIENGKSEGILDIGFPLPTNFALKRTTISGFFETRMKLSAAFQTDFGIRFDLPDGRSGEYTARASLAYIDKNKGFSALAVWGEGFKLPSFFALGHPLVGNPDLRPEEAQNMEFTLRQSFGKATFGAEAFGAEAITLSLSLFHNRFRNLIDFDAELFTSVNRSHVTVKGFEISLESRPLQTLVLNASMTHQSLTLAEEDTTLRSRPKWKGRLEVSWQAHEDVSLSLRAISNGRFYDSSIPTGLVTMKGYILLDASAHWRFSEAVTVGLTLANAMDANYEDSIGFTAKGPTARARIVAQY